MYDQNAQLLFREILRGNTDIPDPPSRIIKCFISSSGKTGTKPSAKDLEFSFDFAFESHPSAVGNVLSLPIRSHHHLSLFAFLFAVLLRLALFAALVNFRPKQLSNCPAASESVSLHLHHRRAQIFCQKKLILKLILKPIPNLL